MCKKHVAVYEYICHQEAQTLSNCILKQMAQKQNGQPIVCEKDMVNPCTGTDLIIIDSLIIT